MYIYIYIIYIYIYIHIYTYIHTYIYIYIVIYIYIHSNIYIYIHIYIVIYIYIYTYMGIYLFMLRICWEESRSQKNCFQLGAEVSALQDFAASHCGAARAKPVVQNGTNFGDWFDIGQSRPSIVWKMKHQRQSVECSIDSTLSRVVFDLMRTSAMVN